MSELFDEDPRDSSPPRSPSRRSRALIITAIVLVVAFFGLTTFATFYTDRLWYTTVGYGGVFSTLFWTRALLFLAFAAIMAVAVGANIYLAYRFRPLFASGAAQTSGLDRYRDAVTPIRRWLVIGISVVLGIFAGTSGAGEWRNYLLWRNGGDFSGTDAYFDKNIGWYVFDLPWYHYLTDFAMVVVVVAFIAAVLVHYLYGGIRLQAADRLSGAAQAQLSALLGVFVLFKALDYWLDRYDLVTRSGSRFTGMSFTGENAILPAKNILLGIALICAVLFLVNIWRRTWLLPSVGLALLAVSAVLLGLIWPGIVQQFQVNPSAADKEAPYIGENIQATREAYGIDDVQVESYSNDATTTGTNANQLSSQAASAPLVDPQLVTDTFQQLQQGRAYYSVADVLDVDRYDINGVDRALVLGVRELDQSGIPASDRNWSNLHTVYTHGNGIIAAFANQRNADDQGSNAENTEGGGLGIQWAEGNQTGQDALSQATGGFESRIYFGEQSPDYSVVGRPDGAAPVELDLQTSASGSVEDDGTEEAPEDTTTYDGAGGVPIGSSFRQLMYAIKFGEPNFLLSGRVNGSSEVLYDRSPRERVEKVAPWLTVDDDAYPTVVDGKILWVLDGYTTTDRYPNSERESFDTMTDDALQTGTGLRTLPTDEINYMRNSVKATVDAYDGTVTLYEWHPGSDEVDDPLLEAWEGAFPGTVQSMDDIPAELLDHLRYPEDLFKVQRYQFARYHVTDPDDFFQGSDRWEVPEDPNSPNNLQPPYRLFLGDSAEGADGTGETWSLTSTYVPAGRSTLASFVSVDSDATSEDYGTIRVLELPSNQSESTFGPGQVQNTFSADADISAALLPYSQRGTAPRYGNVLTIPLDQGLLYLEPVYAQQSSGAGSYPVLTYVLASYGGQVGFGTTLVEAIGDALGVDPNAEPTTPPETGGGGGEPTTPPSGEGTIDEQISAQLQIAEDAFAAADQALSDGDLAEYQRQNGIAADAVQAAVDLAEQRDAGAGASRSSEESTEPSGSATPGS